MSTLSKVFVVINFVLALFFLGASAALFTTHKNYKVEGERIAKESAKTIADLDANLRKKEAQLDDSQDRNRKLQADVQEGQKALQAANVNLSEEAKAKAALEDTLRGRDAELTKEKGVVAELLKVNDGLDRQLKEAIASRDKALESERQKDDQLQRTLLENDTFKKELAEARKEYETAREELEDLRLFAQRVRTDYPEVARMISGQPMPKIDAKVLEVDTGAGLVMLSAGSDNKVELGYTFHVYRGNSYVCDVQVIRVFPKLCGARIMSPLNGAQVQKNDDATTKL